MCNRHGQTPNSTLTRPEIIREATKRIAQIRARLQTSQDRQKSYTYSRLKPLEIQVGNQGTIEIPPLERDYTMWKKGKINSRYIEPFEILARISLVAYKLQLPVGLSNVNLVFHIST